MEEKNSEATADARLDALEKKIDAIYVSTERTRKYFLGTLIASVIFFVLPFIGLLFAIPAFLNSFEGQLDALNLGETGLEGL